MVAAMDAVGVDGAILVSPWGDYRTDTTFAEGVYREYPNRFRLVAPISPAADNIGPRLRDWAVTPGAAGVRLLFLRDHFFEASHPGVVATITGATELGMPINIHCWGYLSIMEALAARHPDALLVLDHLGITQPLRAPAPPGSFDELSRVLALARYSNVALKITGACTYSNRPFPYDDLWEPVGRLIDAFGIERCMWGTDWTRTSNILTYEEGVSAFRDHWPLTASYRAALMGGTATRLYNWARSPAMR
jgi:predicted TIM-barrel fold metal-dependent hydrolase